MDSIKRTPTGRISKARGRDEILLGANGKLPSSFRSRKIELTMDEFIEQIRLLPGKADKAFVKYVVALSQRAQVIFEHSFQRCTFYSSNSKPWQPISETTWKMRQYHGKKYNRGVASKDKILTEFAYLRNSIDVKPGATELGAGLYRRTVWTNPELFRSPVHRGFIYAGVHNNPSPTDTYGTHFGHRKAIQRQFMGHSTYMDAFISKYAHRYLFNEIFNKPSVG